MALQLPSNFERDIQNRDTNLYPVCRIETDTPIWISTNSAIFPNTTAISPILLNIPSLKESIDIEKRNYKISNATLNISNYLYKGQRFSEIVGDESLINKECRIFWISQSVTDINLIDVAISEGTNIEDHWAFQIYFGTIRKYEHGSGEKIKLTVEDRSQSYLHKDFPLTNVGTEANIPDKYKNKYVPMVYGHVDRSPVIPHYSISDEMSDNEGEAESFAEFRLKVDEQGYKKKEQTIQIGTASHLVSALYFFENDEYHNVQRHKQGLGGSGGAENFRYGNTDIILDVDTVEYGEGGEELFNDFTEGFIRCHTVRRFKKEDFVYQSNNGIGGTDGKLHYDESAGIGRIYGTVDVSIGGIYYSGLQDWTSGYFKCFLEPISVPDNLAVDANGNIIKPVTRLLIDVDHYNFGTSGNVSPNTDLDIPTVANSFGGNDPEVTGTPNTHWGVWCGATGTVDYGVTPSHGSNGVFADAHPNVKIYPIGYDNINDSTLGSAVYGTIIDDLSFFGTLTSYDYINIGIPNPRWHLTDYQVNVDESDDISWGVDTTINNAFIVQTYRVMGVADKDYYANVQGRQIEDIDGIFQYTDTPKADDVIKNIMTELNSAVGNGIVLTNDYDWKYQFTINEKINSKKLIENIASASPYIPRFNNLGTFKLDVIQKTYTSTTEAPNTTILEADCIDWSYSRTRIEDVKTRIEFKYHYDYGRGDFSKDLKHSEGATENFINIQEFYPNYENDYYGLDEEHGDSTLIIDDDRGKYIRDDITATRFAEWILMWNCNQHLKINKCRLPLKYMNLEISDIVQFDKVLGNVRPYDIDYSKDSMATDRQINGQQALPFFMITATNKTLNYCEFDLIMMHELKGCDFYDCEGTCNGVAVEDVCGTCTHPDYAVTVEADCVCDNGACNPLACTEHHVACNGVCGGTMVVDCNGDCGGGAVFDECGTCGGNGVDACGYCFGTETDVSLCGSVDIIDISVYSEQSPNPFYWDDVYIDFNDALVQGLYVDFNIRSFTPITIPDGTNRLGLQSSMMRIILKEISTDYTIENPRVEITFPNQDEDFVVPIFYEDNLIQPGSEPGQGIVETHPGLNTWTFDWVPPDADGLYDILFHIPTDQDLGTPIDMRLTFKYDLITQEAGTLSHSSSFMFRGVYDDCPALGDVNGDAGFNVLDIVQLVECILNNNCHIPEMTPYGCAGDLNGDGGYNVLDIVQLTTCVLENNCDG